MGFWRTAEDFLFTDKTISESREAQAARALAQSRAASQAHALGDLQGKIKKEDPLAALLLQLAPGGMIEAMQKTYEPANVAGGDTRLQGVRPVVTAPKLGMDAGVGFTQTPGGTAFTGERPTTKMERANMQNMRADNTHQAATLNFAMEQFAKTHPLEAAKLAEMIRHNQAQEGIGWFNAKKPPSSAVNINMGGGSGGSELPQGYNIRPRQ